jgi:glycosyltransferase involved in cell wall biosynthesis
MINKNKLRVLCLDTEGGYGGSSRSLFNSISNFQDNEIYVEVWCKKKGVIQGQYKRINIKTKITPEMPKITPVPKLSRNLLEFGRFIFIDWPYSKKFRNELKKIEKDFDLIHCNSEALYWLACWIKKNMKTPVTMHKRKNPCASVFSLLQAKVINKYISGLIFITENEKKNFNNYGLSNVPSKVIYNIVLKPDENIKPLNQIPDDNSFKVCTLANYSFARGVDQLIDVALDLKKKYIDNIVFVVAGNIKLSKSLPGALGKVARSGGDLSDYAKKFGVEDMFVFIGYTKHPERVLSGCNLLIRPSREKNPWGRDVLEAFSFGIPVIATGSYSKFVENEVTGFLLDEFNVGNVSDAIIKLSNNRSLLSTLGEQGKNRVNKLCNGRERSFELINFWNEIVNK